MIKKALFIILAILPMVMKAQLAVGEWKVYPVFANNVTRMLDTSEKVYYVSEGNLFSYDKNTDESYSYSVVNKLNENEIHNIYYNKDNKYLLIAYKSGNIDLLYDNGKVINMPDIKDAVLSTEKTINDVCFNDNRIYVATIFGLVIFDDQKHHVIESGIYNKDIRSVEVYDGSILICKDSSICISPVDTKHNTENSFSFLYGWIAEDMKIINNKIIIIANYGTYTTLRIGDIDVVNKSITNLTDVSANDVKLLNEDKEGVYTFNSSTLVKFDNNGNYEKINLPTELQSKQIAMWEGLNSVWVGDKSGISNLDVSGDAITVLKDNFIPESTSVKEVFFLHRGNSGKIYLSNVGQSDNYKKTGWIRSQINTINNGKIENVLPTKFANINGNGAKSIIIDTYNVCEDPEDPNTYYMGSFWEGVYKVTNGESTIKYDWTNSGIISIYGTYACVASAITFDKNNNLWALQLVASGKPVLQMLPAEARKKDTPEASDWKQVLLGDFVGGKDNRILACTKSNMLILSNAYGKIIGYDTKGTYENTSDDTYMIWNKFIDQDGKNFILGNTMAFVEDHNGKVWIGTDNGVIEITKPANLTDEKMTINRIKVPRNDGTQLADYLLETLYVTSIAVDGTNKKWIGTLTSGVYLVSENGDEILEHFTAENSSLPSNTIYSLACDPNSNSVFIGTNVGLVEYSSSTAPASDDYSNVYAYPNPVRPEYTGWITIKGLMDNSLVKIADAAGNVFYSTVSEGGMVTWDGCNTDGQRVKSGVYYVFASQSEEGSSSSGAVTKILVIN